MLEGIKIILGLVMVIVFTSMVIEVYKHIQAFANDNMWAFEVAVGYKIGYRPYQIGNSALLVFDILLMIIMYFILKILPSKN